MTSASGRLREWRLARNLTQAEAARELGVSQPTLSDYERGVKQPRIALALRIAERTAGNVPVESWGGGAHAAQ